MGALEAIRAVESSSEFRAWKAENPGAYLTSAFAMSAEGQERLWLISYFDPKSETLTTFSPAEKKATEEAFMKEKAVPELVIDEVRVGEASALETAMGVLMEGYSQHESKTILVLQKLEAEPLWNITFITAALKVVNVRVSAASGKVLSHNSSAISDYIRK